MKPDTDYKYSPNYNVVYRKEKAALIPSPEKSVGLNEHQNNSVDSRLM